MTHWYPQTKLLKELVDYVQNTPNQSRSEVEMYVLKQLKRHSYPYIMVDYIIREGLLRRNNQ